MKQITISILSIVIIICAILLSEFYKYKEKDTEIKEFNTQFEIYKEKQITGADIATVINKAIDINEKNFIKKEYQTLF